MTLKRSAGCALVSALSVYLAAAPSALAAGDFDARSLLEDTKQYFTAPIRWDAGDWMQFRVSVAAIGVAHAFDGSTRTHFVRNIQDPVSGKDLHSTRDALPAAALVAGTFVYATVLDDQDGYSETRAMLEAGAFSAASGEILKLAAGRKRPYDTASPNEWRAGGDSFPSVHSSAAFAIGAVFAESGNDEYRWIRRIAGYGIATATSYIRVHDNVHWLSDTVAGAALGIATAQFVLHRQDSGSHTRRGTLQLQALNDGWMLTYTASIKPY